MKEVREIKNYFSLHILLLKLSGIRLEPFPENMTLMKKLLIIVASALIVLLFPALYAIDEALEAPNLELEELTYNMSYCITHFLGECFLRNKMMASISLI